MIENWKSRDVIRELAPASQYTVGYSSFIFSNDSSNVMFLLRRNFSLEEFSRVFPKLFAIHFSPLVSKRKKVFSLRQNYSININKNSSNLTLSFFRCFSFNISRSEKRSEKKENAWNFSLCSSWRLIDAFDAAMGLMFYKQNEREFNSFRLCLLHKQDKLYSGELNFNEPSFALEN